MSTNDDTEICLISLNRAELRDAVRMVINDDDLGQSWSKAELTELVESILDQYDLGGGQEINVDQFRADLHTDLLADLRSTQLTESDVEKIVTQFLNDVTDGGFSEGRHGDGGFGGSVVFVGALVRTADHGRNTQTTFNESEAGVTWVDRFVGMDQQVISDFEIFNKFLYYEAQNNHPDTLVIHMTIDKYRVLVGDAAANEYRRDLAIVDDQTMGAGQPVHGYIGRSELAPGFYMINNNQEQGKVYNGGRLST